MTMHQTIKKMSAWDDILVPAAGEIVIEQGSNKIKIGDGKTNFANLPYVEGNPPENKLSDRAKEIIENNIDLIERNEYDAFYNEIHDVELAREVSKALFKAGLNPKPYLTNIPSSIRHILEPDEIWAEDTSRLYTKSEMDAMLDEWNKKLFMQMGIPKSMIKVGN